MTQFVLNVVRFIQRVVKIVRLVIIRWRDGTIIVVRRDISWLYHDVPISHRIPCILN